ncbi:uncharacterized protein LOC135093899 [Scylla paramamosain]|uniref:uncharacterized protein LOC135093899 n=1 Tax=Scylla paramamosain TaxID=85552 RepID=UPI0030834EEA
MTQNQREEEEEEEEKRRRKEREEEEESERHLVRWESNGPLPPIPDINFASFLLSVLTQHGGKKALIDAATGKHHTYSDICAMVPRVCANLKAAGVEEGDRVMILSPNHIDYPITTLAIQLLPATCVPVNPTLSPEEVAHIVGVSGVHWAVVEEGVVDLVERVRLLLPNDCLKQVWVIGSSSSHPSLSQLMRGESGNASVLEKDSSRSPGNVAALMPFSSGTTGLPKGVLLPHRSLLTVVMQNKCLRDASKEAGSSRTSVLSRVLLVLPLYHIYANNTNIITLISGGRAVLMSKFSLPDLLGTIEKYKVTYVPLVPHIANYMINSPLLKQYDLSSLMAFASGSAPITPTAAKALTEKTGRGLGIGYGLTETCATVSINSPMVGIKEGSVGRVLPYVEVKIVTPGSREALARGKEGEVWVRGPGVMLGYAPTPTSPPSPWGLQEGGWLPTGDLGYCDKDGFLFITDRIKDVIKVKGFQVAPSEIEAVLQEVEGVEEAAVVGVPSPRLGEAPRAYVVLVPGVPAPSHEALLDYVAARLARHKHLAGGLEFVESLPKNSIGKVLKRRLREDYLKGLKQGDREKGAGLTSKL